MDQDSATKVMQQELRNENNLLRAKVAMLEALLEQMMKERDEALRLASIA